MNFPEALPYKHQQLSDASKSIRLLTLLQDPLYSPVRCELLEVSFPSEQMYTALSYVWGPPDTGCHVLINDRPLAVRKNLKAFLLRIRSRLAKGQTVTLWADAICIDQASTPEKNYQVRMMGEIYSNASDVIAWLGDDGRIERLFKSLEDYQRKLARLSFEDANAPNYSRTERDTSMQAFMEYPEFGPDLLAFYNVEYFHRAWIIQELILAPSLSLICGSSHLTHYGLITLFNHLRYQRVMTGRNKVDIILGHYLDSKIEISHTHENQFTLNELIKLYGYTECSDPHDKIYAFIGTAKDLRTDFVVDYNKPLRLLLMETILHDVQGSGMNDYFGITYLLNTSDLDSTHLYSHDAFLKKVVWASSFVKVCQQTLPPSLLCRRLPVQLSLVGKVYCFDGLLAFVNYTRSHAVGFGKDLVPTWRIVQGDKVIVGDLVFQLLSLCFFYRWCGLHIELVAIGIAADSAFSKKSSMVWEHAQAIYTENANFDVEKNVDISSNSTLLLAMKDWHNYCNSTVTEKLDVSITISNFLVILQADFPNFVNQGGAAVYT